MAVDTKVQANNNTIQQFEALFNYATIGIVVTDHGARIINFNKNAEAQFGYSKDEILGKLIEHLIPDQFHSAHISERNEFYKHPEPRSMGAGRDLYGKKKDGSVFPVEVSLSHYSSEGSTFVIAFVIDITVRKTNEAMMMSQKDELEKITRQVLRLNAELEQRVEDRTKSLSETLAELEKSKIELSEALENEKELSDLKSRFVTLASHEFRTPLSTILSSAYLLEQYTSTEGKTGKHILRIKNAVTGMKSILEDFLSLGKLDEGLIEVRNETLSADECFLEIRTVVSEMDQMLKPGQKIALSHSGSNLMLLDKNLLKNILINFVSNAIKFSPANTFVYVNCRFKINELEVSITDTGIGMSQEDQQHLFKRFFRAHNAGNIQGTGLGLHIVSKYPELMQGSIEIKSVLDSGSTFAIHIPVQSSL